MFDIFLTHLRNMHQSILMHSDIYESSKINHISHCTLKDHTLFQILHIKYIRPQNRFRHLISWVSCRFFQLFNDVTKCRLSYAKLLCELLVIFDLL